ncbi:hypothetical protein CEXT_129191 [Caerostris extrusa]|uniref:Uncharacterized protein n=1 Tax=Caerostris extrusa TaxID=172846 RepID=A0AAV4XV20_CAEEX|nr:hypothetical protein CEXT_129191 [Caerostris extrusa]
MCHHRLMRFASTPPICQSLLGLLRRRNKLNASVTYEAGACSEGLGQQGVSSSKIVMSNCSTFALKE